MTIEIIHRPAQCKTRPVRLLFVHGISVGAWIWDLHFLRHFSDLGYDCTAISLRGHGKSAGRGEVRDFSLGDFSADVAWASRRMGAPHVIVGHSLGGAVVQNFIMRGGTRPRASH